MRQSAYRGVEVYRPTRGDVSEAFEIRLALEPLATELAASHISDDALARLDQLMEQMEHRDQADFGSELNGQFHFAIYQAAESPKLLEFIGRLRYGGSAYVRLLNSVSTSNDEYRTATDTEHRSDRGPRCELTTGRAPESRWPRTSSTPAWNSKTSCPRNDPTGRPHTPRSYA